MRTIIAGSRGITDYEYVAGVIALSGFKISKVVSGSAKGVGRLGEQWAICHGVPVEQFPPDWSRYGTSAGHVRNAQMAANADALIAIWDGKSPGTAGMIRIAQAKKLRTYVNIEGFNEQACSNLLLAVGLVPNRPV